ncbi:hypothetical protein [Pyrobaculum sp.]|uniref:hypothetical protein n=1 Tax=Pyrobaculum sp. TaxID=2004705 RepID=UPI003D0F0E1F
MARSSDSPQPGTTPVTKSPPSANSSQLDKPGYLKGFLTVKAKAAEVHNWGHQLLYIKLGHGDIEGGPASKGDLVEVEVLTPDGIIVPIVGRVYRVVKSGVQLYVYHRRYGHLMRQLRDQGYMLFVRARKIDMT